MLFGWTPNVFKNQEKTKAVKSQLAKLMAQENITVVHRNTKTAMFDTKKRVLILPNWDNVSDSLYDLLVGHEIGHALETPRLDLILKEIVNSIDSKNPRGIQSLINIVEDARIEKLVKIRYPGMRRSFIEGYADLVARGFFGDNCSQGRFEAYSFIDRINLHFKLGSAAIIDFSTKEQPYIDQIAACETWDEVIQAVRDVYAFCKEQSQTAQDHDSGEDSDENKKKKKKNQKDNKNKDKKEKKQQKQSKEKSESDDDGDDSDEDEGDGDEEGDESEGDSAGDSDDGEGDEEGDEDSSGADGDEASDEDGDSDSEDGEAGDEDSDEDTKSKNGEGNKEDKAPRNYDIDGETDQIWESKKDKLAKSGGPNIQYATIPNLLAKDYIVPYKKIMGLLAPKTKNMAELRTFKEENDSIVSFLVKEFEMRKAADQYNRSSVAKTGVIDTNKLHTYKYNDDLFRRVTTIPGGKNHGLVMFIDWSSSMTPNIAGTIEQLLNIVMFCRRVQIPFEVFAFTTSWNRNEYDTEHKSSFEEEDVILAKFNLLQMFSSSMPLEDFNTMLGIMLMLRTGHNLHTGFTLGSTPLNQSIIVANDLVKEFKKKTNAQIVNVIFLTDGESDGPKGVYTNGVRAAYDSHAILRDPVTKMEYKGGYKDFTKNLLLALKDRMKVKNIGFFVTNNSKASIAAYYPKEDDAKRTNLLGVMERDKCLICVTAGYDEYYLVPGGESLKVTNKENKRLTFRDARDTKAMAADFSMFNKKQTVNRVLLMNFIKQVA